MITDHKWREGSQHDGRCGFGSCAQARWQHKEAVTPAAPPEPDVELPCAGCGTKFMRSAAQVRKATGRVFCSRRCAAVTGRAERWKP